MKFYATNLIKDEITELVLDETESFWRNKIHGFEFKRNTMGRNFLPVMNNKYSGLIECVEGYFVVEVTDPLGHKGVLNLHAINDLVCCGDVQLYPGVWCNEKSEGKKLKKAGVTKPELGFEILPDIISYGFNEGEAYESYRFSDHHAVSELEDGCNDLDKYHWKIL